MGGISTAKHEKWDSRRMGLGGIPHRALHILPLTRAQKNWPGQRDVQLTHVRHRSCAARSRILGTKHVQVRARRGRHLFSRDVHGAHDDAPEGTAQRERDVDVNCPLSLDVRRRTRAPLVFRWVVEGDRRGEVSWERWELPLLGRRRGYWRGRFWCFVRRMSFILGVGRFAV